ncbi:MAG: AMP-binding protein, partial [Proteobacteria bacterium]|nr:AMP-binding protein [Pseudomonadota bacterium]
GAVAVLLPPWLDEEELAEALRSVPLRAVVTDPDHAQRLKEQIVSMVLVLGGGGGPRNLGEGLVDMEAIDPTQVYLPSWYRPNPGRARDLAIKIIGPKPGGGVRVSRISNGRWAFSALGAAAACTLTPNDTVYCCLPLHHPAGILVSVGSALVGGARLALSPHFDPEQFWSETRRNGVTVVFYAGEMVRYLVNAPPSRGDRDNPVRLFAGSGMRPDVWRRLRERRFGRVGVLEFYASTERNLVLANASGAKVGSVGQPLPGSAHVEIVEYDFQKGKLRENDGRLCRCQTNEPGVGIALLPRDANGPSMRVDVFEPGDRWFVTGDVLRRDEDGDYWFVDRLANMINTGHSVVSTRRIENCLYEMPYVQLVAVIGAHLPGQSQQAPVAFVVSLQTLDEDALSTQLASLAPHERPHLVRRVDNIAMTEGFRPLKSLLRLDAPAVEEYDYDQAEGRFKLRK